MLTNFNKNKYSLDALFFVAKGYDLKTIEEVIERVKKEGKKFKIILPKHLLTGGRYSVSVGSGWPYLGAIDSQPDAVVFELEEINEDISHKSYAKHRGGLLIMPLNWNTYYEK